MVYKLITLDSCHSTQVELKNQLERGETHPIAIRTFNQTQGKGRRGSEWTYFPESVAISLTYPLEEIRTLTPLKIGVLICSYFEKEYNHSLNLKWPNDILKNNVKVGGIICEVYNDVALVGIGLNLFSISKQSANFEYDFIFDEKVDFKIDSFLEFFLNFKCENIKSSWESYCSHLNRKVSFHSDEKITEDIFLGIGENGEGIFKETSPQYSGFLTYKKL